MTFRELILRLAERIGTHQIPVSGEAVEIRDFLAPDGIHHELVTRIVRMIYRRNGCGHLDATVAAPATYDALTPIHREMLRNTSTDVDQMRFMNDLAHEIGRCFGTLSRPPRKQDAAPLAIVLPLARRGARVRLYSPQRQQERRNG